MGYSKEQAKAEINKLVEDFKKNKARLKTQAEAQIENNFIRPLFECLNWNTRNTALAVADYEFILNRTSRGGKRPDYTLQLDGQHLLVMDAKQVKYDMHDTRWLNQVYSYGYSTQNLSPARRIDFAVLTDFEEFIVLDCTLHVGNPKALSNFLVLNWTCDDFINQFDRLWDLFERENMRRTARTRRSDTPRGLWALALSPRKIKANRTPPDKAFLADMDNDQTGWRVCLAKDMKKHNPTADGTLITAAVQLLIDRLIFVKALSDREIEDDYLAQLAETVESNGLAESDTGWFAACRKIFDKLDRFYNGSIFQSRPELEAVTVSNKTVRDIIRSLQPENSPYNFAVLPVEILGTIYERFLGRVVRTTEQRVKIEEKPEVRKAGGVYYTPQYIVEYIVKNTVGKLLEKCRTPVDAARLKILDPACGSGSFLVGAYSALIDWHIRYYDGKKRLSERDRAEAYYDTDGRVRLTARLKRQILLNNLFGVDIDPQATEVTRFSLSLKAMEDTHREELSEERTLFKETVLPDLSSNIKCGNSLIGPDYFSGKMFPDSEELRRANPFDWQREFPAIFSSDGFDAVIGNPPYIRMESFKDLKRYLKQNYASHDERSDLYAYFIEKGHKLIKQNGRFGMIVSNKFLRSNYGKPLREFLRKNSLLHRVVDFAGLPVFQGATVRTIVLLASRGLNRDNLMSYTPPIPAALFQAMVSGTVDIEQASAEITYQINTDTLTQSIWSFSKNETNTLISRLQAIYTPLEKYCNGHIGYGIKTGLESAFVIDNKTRKQIVASNKNASEIIKPYINGRDIRKYFIDFKDIYLIYTFHGIDIAKYKEVIKYLRPFKDRLLRRATKQEWYELQQPQFNYSPNFDNSKIVFPDIAAAPRFAMDETGFYGSTTTFFIAQIDFYLLGLLNSRLSQFYFGKTCAALEGKAESYLRFKRQYVEGFPVRKIDVANPSDLERHAKIIQLVKSMQTLHKHKSISKTQTEQEMIQRQIDATESEIDALVYELYDLTKEEISIVEEETSFV